MYKIKILASLSQKPVELKLQFNPNFDDSYNKSILKEIENNPEIIKNNGNILFDIFENIYFNLDEKKVGDNKNYIPKTILSDLEKQQYLNFYRNNKVWLAKQFALFLGINYLKNIIFTEVDKYESEQFSFFDDGLMFFNWLTNRPDNDFPMKIYSPPIKIF